MRLETRGVQSECRVMSYPPPPWPIGSSSNDSATAPPHPPLPYPATSEAESCVSTELMRSVSSISRLCVSHAKR